MGFIEIIGLCKSYKDKSILSGINLEIEEGEVLAILGRSGAGKTTLLRLIAGLETPDKGSIKAGDTVFYDKTGNINIPPEDRRIGMVFQDLALWPHMTVGGHLDFVLKSRRLSKKEREEKIQETLRILRLEEQVDCYPKTLSGGEKQRVALGRVLVQQPMLLLLDEPVSNLDLISINEFKKEVLKMKKTFNVTTLYVTHNYLDVVDVADQLAVINEGSIAQIGATQDVLEKPKDKLLADLLGGK
jgi:iron(III) transport system ATP-binding protein